MSTTRSQIREAILDLVPTDGSDVGNVKLQKLLAERLSVEVDEALYIEVRGELVLEGLLATGRGRGGSVRLVAAGAEELVVEEDAEFSLTNPEAGDVTQVRPRKGARKSRASSRKEADVISYRHADRRKNNPDVGMVNPDTDPAQPKTRWAYDPHIDPALQFDSGRAQTERLIDDALASGDEAVMRQALEELKRQSSPYLNWAGKAERTSFEVDTVSLHVHERIDPASILRAVRNRIGEGMTAKAVQMGLFSPPFENLPLRDALGFYKHDKGWSNRLVAGDSLLVMNSLLQKEGMAGQVQMIYIDPPYGIRYGSNFQPFVGKRDVSDRKDDDLTQEPEMIKAFRDTWELGIHSYLTYLRDRVRIAHELLTNSGSIFIQISDENVHLVRNILDDVFGVENCVAQIVVQKTGGLGTAGLKSVADYLIWYAKEKSALKYHQLYHQKQAGIGEGSGGRYDQLASPTGDVRRSLTSQERRDPSLIPSDWRPFQLTALISAAFRENTTVDYGFRGEVFHPGENSCWKTTTGGLDKLNHARRVTKAGKTIRYVRFLDDFPAYEITNVWDDVAGAADKIYVVQTSAAVIERCLLMTTDPGDLVFDLTCGSGTTAFVAEKWGRRWITCDTSRVAVTLAKQRLMTASYDYYELKYPHEGLKGGFIYKTVPHVTLKSIANNPEIDEIHERLHPAILETLDELNLALRNTPPLPFQVEEGGRKGKLVDFKAPASKTVDLPSGERAPAGALLEWEVPFDFPEGWPASARKAFDAFHNARRGMQQRMDDSIAAHADQETLYDQPQIARDKLRITGPFSVEAVPFPSVLSLDETRPQEEADVSIARSGETSRQHQWRDELLKTGIRGKGGQVLKFASLETLPDTRYLHASGHLADTDERVVVSFGPEHAALEQRQVEMALREAEKLRPAATKIVFCAFTFDPEAAKDIDEVSWKGVTLLKAQMNTDLLTEDLKRARSSNQSFWLMGQPDIDVRKREDGLYEVEVNGFDYFDMTKGELVSGGKGKIATWMLDTDYDERSLFPHQVFFPMAGAKDGWNKLRKDIKAELDEEQLEQFHGTVSLPFEAGENRKVAIKVVDDRGIESLKVVELS